MARLSLLYGPSRSGRASYFDRTLAALREGEPQTFFEDEFRTPLDLATAAETLVRLAESDVTGPDPRRRPRAGQPVRPDPPRRRRPLGLDPGLVRANRQADVALAEPRPADVSLDTSRLAALFPDLRRPTIEEAMGAFGPLRAETPAHSRCIPLAWEWEIFRAVATPATDERQSLSQATPARKGDVRARPRRSLMIRERPRQPPIHHPGTSAGVRKRPPRCASGSCN